MFQPIDPKEPPQKGVTYRSNYYFKFPWSSTIAGMASQAVATAKPVLRLSGIDVLAIYTRSPELTVQTAGGRYTRWQLTIEWRLV